MNESLRIQWGERLQQLREERGLSIGEVARRVGTDKAWYRRIELGDVGTRGPGDDMKMKVAAALGVRVEDIWSYPAEVSS